MDIRSLRLFLHLSQTLHFAKTAQQMHVSPSTLSRCIQRLEEQVGQPILKRDNRTVTLTHAGIEFLKFARQTLDNWQSLKQQIADSSGFVTGELKLFCSVTAVYSHLPGILERFRQDYPKIEIQLTTGDPSLAVDLIQRNQVDVAITAHPDVLPEAVYFSELDEIPLLVIGPALAGSVNSLISQSQIPWAELPFILPDHGPARRRADAWFKTMEFEPKIYAKVSGHEALVSMVALGCGVGIAPSVVVDNSPVKDRITTLPSSANIEPFTIGVVAQKRRVQDPILAAFLSIVN
ncbi:HTH-type transcriptional activator IlvY [Paraferrimonas sedimenticola]|uniref:Transcriptional regulator IlvY n=1 Tax=Paraferrimonas sedimenticola TaxID=375674 RepID=A0AA37RSL3_9GAMM|nr:HTH-type transcriptional activator IlvY [Paraferrimonas sedimenticola]GLP95258.1 transcriptional regulator IlvY [Paraferrimonas sedimenticola]